MAELVILGATLSPFVSKVLAAADYKRFTYTFKEVLKPQDLKKINPATGKMPVLRVDGELVYDSTEILRRFDALEPRPALLAEDATIAARQRILEDWSDESLYWYLMALRWSPENEARTVAQLSGVLPGLIRPFAAPMLRRLIGRTTKAQGLGRVPYDILIAEVGERLDDLTLLLEERAFFCAEHPSVADFAIYGMFDTGMTEATPDFRELVLERPKLADWHGRVQEATRH